MFKRILIQFTNEVEVNHLVKFAKSLKKEYSDIEIAGIYVRDVSNYNAPSIPLQNEPNIPQYNLLEDKTEKRIQETFKLNMPNCDFYLKKGNTSEIILDELRLFDLLVVSKQDKITLNLKEILKNHHKPIILVPQDENYSFNKILIADDQRLEVNKSLFNFINFFTKVNTFDAITVNTKNKNLVDLNTYLSKIDKKISYDFQLGHIDDAILNALTNYDLLIMGELKHSFTFERLARKTGIKLLEKTSKPIFIS